jgi:NAD(P)-dependent dehydrogenase (short-subunit alcohol dehydrogenase family)
MESCGGAHHWARRLQAHGFKVRMIAPQFVKPHVKTNKNDANDAEAICEALCKETGATAIRCDAQAEVQVAQFFDEIDRLGSSPNVVVCNASTRTRGLCSNSFLLMSNGRCRSPPTELS